LRLFAAILCAIGAWTGVGAYRGHSTAIAVCASPVLVRLFLYLIADEHLGALGMAMIVVLIGSINGRSMPQSALFFRASPFVDDRKNPE
jgi:hypothetical protein